MLSRGSDSAPKYDEHMAFLCGCKGEPYSFREWEREIARLEAKIADAKDRMRRAAVNGYCPPSRFEAP